MSAVSDRRWSRVIFDLDGVLYQTNWPAYDERLLPHCQPVPGAAEATRAAHAAGWEVVIWTARGEHLRRVTEDWLSSHDIYYDTLWMDKPTYNVLVDDRALEFDGKWAGILGRAIAFQTWWESLRDGPRTFEQALAETLRRQREIMVNRQEKYGPWNIKNAGVMGALDRAQRDKMARLRRVYEREELRRMCLTAGFPPDIVDRYAPPIGDFADEQVEDAHVDAANYVGPISLMLRWDTWGRPLGQMVAPDFARQRREEDERQGNG